MFRLPLLFYLFDTVACYKKLVLWAGGIISHRVRWYKRFCFGSFWPLRTQFFLCLRETFFLFLFFLVLRLLFLVPDRLDPLPKPAWTKNLRAGILSHCHRLQCPAATSPFHNLHALPFSARGFAFCQGRTDWRVNLKSWTKEPMKWGYSQLLSSWPLTCSAGLATYLINYHLCFNNTHIKTFHSDFL